MNVTGVQTCALPISRSFAEGLAKATSPTMVLGTNNCNFFDYTYGSPFEICQYGGPNMEMVQNDLFFRNTTDTPDARMSIESGRTANQLQGFLFGKYDNSAFYWDLITTAAPRPISKFATLPTRDRKSTRLNSSHIPLSRMP